MKIQKNYKVEERMKKCRQELQNEIEFLKTADHPFIIRFEEWFPLQPEDPKSRLCIVLEYAEGCDLSSKMIQYGGPIPEELALAWFAQVCLGLARMHQEKQAHRDVKPDNILIVKDKFGEVAKLGDFGSVKEISSFDIQTLLVGTPLYFAPERADRDYTEKVDVYSMGIVLYQMLNGGGHPINYDFNKGDIFNYMHELQYLPLKQMPSHFSQECQDLVLRLLTKDPAQRPSIFDVLSTQLIYSAINQFTHGKMLSVENSNKITQQLLDLKIKLDPAPTQIEKAKEAAIIIEEVKEVPQQFEEEKELPPLHLSQLSIDPPSISDNHFAISHSNLELDLNRMSLQPSNLFQQQMLDRLIATFNKPSNNYTLILNDKGQSKMAECILKIHGWKWSLQELNQLAQTEAQWAIFEGTDWLQQGVYYGEMLYGNRHGYGIVYTTNTETEWLYECQWNHGIPIEGRYIKIWIHLNTWTKFEGTLNHTYELHGQGSYHEEGGHSYQGGWNEGSPHGQGKRIYNWGDSYEGGWKDAKYHGQGRYTDEQGGYREGEWKKGDAIGVHKYYSKNGKLKKIVNEDTNEVIMKQGFWSSLFK
ncbi:hypothetical protein FGO68_gene16484 [Halteria grandinella]|uniref:Protein kinase domain-containing protein n=1 Tax=Halteria grandinella TaxID=5974 RepID=A0A8J8NW16_HALGN|nr:hypothetical protein FGO68_gene16484 [Halteria grandinella]